MESNITASNGAVERASYGAHQAIDKVSGALRPGVEHLADDAHQAVERAAGAAFELKERLRVGANQLKVAQERFSADRRSQIRESPMVSVGLALGVGIALGWLLRSR